ncbi:elongation factor P maturation arginine rhamnosyltransferase EarP [Shewanella olleyana]|uniref:elongation factor P maturation arginine rhamnosyltransferase EarP n=1 Tax=Shewanella olleyana TaxID=135626 RepID=UPI00200D420C|nr:elongation factor P maturation arginine rhamnosyltransferase EarP [Shewanella olleyana]MCL1065602.1 elongation factor P maturation arginine rhamnosyltransferase EarP [Shewanella olleyana]
MTNETPAASSYKSPHWDIFCVVVDNYGDIGVTWRLAKQLAAEYQIEINLWVDDLNSFSHILPELDKTLSQQQFFGVNIFKWNKPLDIPYRPGSVLIEAFACELPSQVLSTIDELHQESKTNFEQSINTASKPPVWLNLEYLSAEDWVDGCHGLPSMQASGINKHFYFPGFTSKSGGLICESDLFNQRDKWQSSPSNKLALFKKLGLIGIEANDIVISVFSYETLALTALCNYWANIEVQNNSEQTAIHALIPLGKSLASIESLISTPLNKIKAGQQFTVGNLTIHILPMTAQTQFDRLLWSCDFNIVRGEDSFLRAQWAAKPFIWHIYPQEDDYHLVKLQAFVNIYCLNLEDDAANAWSKTNFAFNQQESNVVEHWQQLICAQSALQQHAKHWPIDAKKDADLASRLVEFVKTS